MQKIEGCTFTFLQDAYFSPRRISQITNTNQVTPQHRAEGHCTPRSVLSLPAGTSIPVSPVWTPHLWPSVFPYRIMEYLSFDALIYLSSIVHCNLVMHTFKRPQTNIPKIPRYTRHFFIFFSSVMKMSKVNHVLLLKEKQSWRCSLAVKWPWLQPMSYLWGQQTSQVLAVPSRSRDKAALQSPATEQIVATLSHCP